MKYTRKEVKPAFHVDGNKTLKTIRTDYCSKQCSNYQRRPRGPGPLCRKPGPLSDWRKKGDMSPCFWTPLQFSTKGTPFHFSSNSSTGSKTARALIRRERRSVGWITTISTTFHRKTGRQIHQTYLQ
jgi:hypothetical protein